jgi:membrane-associated protease RseP (regulator of RpoE activity)
MIHRFLLCAFCFSLVIAPVASAQPAGSRVDSGVDSNSVDSSVESNYDRGDDSWASGNSSDESGGNAYLGVDISDVSPDRVAELKLKDEHGVEITMVDEDAPAGKAGLHAHDVILSLNGNPVENEGQLRRMIKETPPGRVVALGISRDGQAMTIKVQLADRRKSMAWQPKMPEMPDMPKMPSMPDFDLPGSILLVHSGLRSGLMIENINAQLGEFFGVKDGNGVLVRSVEKGSRGEKAGFRAGDVVIKVNSQMVHDASDFNRALRSSSGGTAAVTVMRDRRQLNLTLTLPEKKDSGTLLEETFDFTALCAQTQQAVNRAGEELARLGPAISEEVQQALRSAEVENKDSEKKLHDAQRALRDSQRKMQEKQRELERNLEKDQQRLRHRLSGAWAEI